MGNRQDTISPGDEIFRVSVIKTAVNLQYGELILVIPIFEDDYQNRHTPLSKVIDQEGTVGWRALRSFHWDRLMLTALVNLA